MKRIVIIAQKVDEQDDLLGFFVDWIKEFKKHANVNVIALKTPSRKSKFVRWMMLMIELFWKIPKTDIVFAHMSPVFAVLAGPWAMLWRKPIYLWYLHRSNTWKLRLAERFATKIFTASAGSLTLKSKKIIAVGHGINVEKYKTKRDWNRTEPLEILAVGRISPIKNYETLLHAALHIKIVGRPIMPYDFAYFEKLKKIGGAEFVGFVPYTNMPEYYRNADILVNLSPTGGIDKAVLEAMASGCLVLVANHAFKPYFSDDRLFFEHGNAEDLAQKIKALMALSPDEKMKLSNMLQASVVKHHSLDQMINRIITLIL